MKAIILLILCTYTSFAQTAVYNKIKKEGNFKEYQTKSGNILKVGDTISTSLPGNGREFLFITQGNQPTGTIIANTKVLVTKIKTIGNETRGYKTYILFKGYGLIPVFIEYESALEIGEIKNPFTLDK